MSNNKTKKIGLIIGREWSWPSAFINEVTQRQADVSAEFIKVGGTNLDDLCEYDVLIDRMSHEIPYYRTYMKYAALQGTYVINNPFTWSADDKFVGVALMKEMNLRVPATVVLPNKRVETQIVPESFRNLVYPMDWKGIIDYVGVPAILKDIHTGGRRFARRVSNVDDLIQVYDESDTRTVLLQQILESDQHIHCFVFGERSVRAIAFARTDDQYQAEIPFLNGPTRQAIEADALRISRALGYDMNMVEFVLYNDQPYVINPSNPAPMIDIDQMPAKHFNWCVQEMADFAIEMALHPQPQHGVFRPLND